jgi:HPt (histidine-containing phosphotransfer) domain-containing protein
LGEKMAIVYEIDKELEEIVPAFMNSRKKDIESLKNFFAEKNYEEIRSIGHKVKGTAGSYEFMELSEIGSKIEKAAADHDDEALGSLVIEYEDHVNAIDVKYI